VNPESQSTICFRRSIAAGSIGLRATFEVFGGFTGTVLEVGRTDFSPGNRGALGARVAVGRDFTWLDLAPLNPVERDLEGESPRLDLAAMWFSER